MYVLRIILGWLKIVAGLMAAIAVAWLATQSVLHLHLLNVQTGSMRPTFQPHDALIMRPTRPNELRIGQVVAYKSPRNSAELVTHRIVRLLPKTNSFQTKGDVPGVPDPVMRDSLITGGVVAVLPGLGRLFTWVQTWPGLVACVYVPAVAITAGELRTFERTHKRAHFYSLSQA